MFPNIVWKFCFMSDARPFAYQIRVFVASARAYGSTKRNRKLEIKANTFLVGKKWFKISNIKSR